MSFSTSNFTGITPRLRHLAAALLGVVMVLASVPSAAQAQGLTIGNLVFVDANGNQHFDAGEGRSDVTVQLWHVPSVGPETLQATTLTDASGSYSFTGLVDGDYKVKVPGSQFDVGGPLQGMISLPGAQLTGDDDTGEDGQDSFDMVGSGVGTMLLHLTAGQAPSGAAESGFDGSADDADDANGDLTIDFGFYRPLTIGNLIFADMNGNNHADAGEGIPNVVVQLFRTGEDPLSVPPLQDAVSDSDGSYSFGGLMQGSYFVHVPAAQFGPGGPLEGALSVPGTGGPLDDDDAAVGDNGNDDALPAVHGISSDDIMLMEGGSPMLGDGETGFNSFTDDDADSDGNLTIDFGFVFAANKMGIGNLVFLDTNNNGYFEEGEGVQGVVVQLFAQGQNPQTDSPLATRTTNTDGVYFFGSVSPGSYFLHIPKTEFAQGKPLFAATSVTGVQTADDNLGEEGIDATYPYETGISSGSFTLTLHGAPMEADIETGAFAGVDDFRDDMVDLTHDFGFVRALVVAPMSVGNLVFRDANFNGHYDAGELGIGGVTVQLFHQGADASTASPVAEQTTAPDGTYMFTGLTPGSFFLHIPASEFATGKPLVGLLSSTGNGGDTNDDDEVDENGVDDPDPATNGISTVDIELRAGLEPVEQGFAATMDDASDVNGDLTVDFGFTVNCPQLTITPDPLPQVTQYATVSIPMVLTGSTGAVTWTKLSGNLPQGVTLSSGGLISGTATAAGFYDFTVKAQQADGCFAVGTLTLEVVAAANLGVGNLVFYDADGNGIYSPDEGVFGVEVKLFHAGDDPSTATPLASTVTNTLGLYHFSQLSPGNYFIHIPASQFLITGPLYQKVSAPGVDKDVGIDDDAGEDGIDSASPTTTGISSHDFELAEGTEPTVAGSETGIDAAYDNASDADVDLTIDLGFIDAPDISVGLGNLVFRDDNSNQVFDEGEGIDGVTVQLFAANANPLSSPPLRTTLTSLGGRYIFLGLQPGSYKVFIPGSQFAPGAMLYGCVPLPAAGASGAGDDNVDQDAIYVPTPASSGVVTTTVTLALAGAPRDSTTETGADHTSDNAADANTDLTVDLGFARDCHTIVVAPSSLAPVAMQASLNVQLHASGGAAPYTYIFSYGSVPQGVVLNTDGSITGAPESHGDFVFGVQVIDDFGCFAIQEYTLTVTPPPLAVGNVVFFDRNANGVADEGEGVDGVTVQLFTNTQTPGVDASVTHAVTSDGGRYLIDNLAPGWYQLHIPAAMFASGAPLWHMKSVPGVVSGSDDDAGEDGQEALDPSATGVTSIVFSLEPGACPAGAAESGLSGASDDARDSDIDLTRDFGFIDTSTLPASYTAWQTDHPGVGGPTGNGDGDSHNNLFEYAFGTDPSTGAQTGSQAFRVTENQANGQFSVQLRRRHGSQGDLTYLLQVINNLAQSPGGWAPTQLVPTVVNNGDGTETLTYGPLDSDPALPPGTLMGFVRVAVSLDSDHNGTPEETASSEVIGWLTRSLATRNQSYSMPFVTQEVFSGMVDSVGPTSISVGASIGSVSVSTLFSSGYEYYVEVISGDEEGQRWEVDEATSSGSNIVLLPAHARSTKTTLPVDLAGDQIAVRPHWRVVDLFPPSDFHGNTSPATADNLLFWDNATSSYTTLWLVSVGTPRWLKVTGGATVYDNMVISPTDGLFAKPRTSTLSTGATGLVRTWKFACPLKTGVNFIGNPYPVSQSPAERSMTVTGGFTGAVTQTSADRVYVWNGDATTTLSYDTYYLLKSATVERWLKSGAGATDQSASKFFYVNTAAFINSIAGQPNWLLLPTWTP